MYKIEFLQIIIDIKSFFDRIPTLMWGCPLLVRGISVPTLMWGFCGILNIYSKQDPCIMSFLFNFLNNLEHSFGRNILKVIVFKCICFIHVLFLHIVVWRVICYSWRYGFLLFLRIASVNFFYIFQKNSLGEFVHNYIYLHSHAIVHYEFSFK